MQLTIKDETKKPRKNKYTRLPDLPINERAQRYYDAIAAGHGAGVALCKAGMRPNTQAYIQVQSHPLFKAAKELRQKILSQKRRHEAFDEDNGFPKHSRFNTQYAHNHNHLDKPHKP
jgi:hypothetical protein